MPDVEVTCINNRLRNNHQGIAHVGGSGWKWPIADVIRSIEERTNTFFTIVNNKRAEVGVVNGPNGKYVRTYADGAWNDNLLGLQQCP